MIDQNPITLKKISRHIDTFHDRSKAMTHDKVILRQFISYAIRSICQNRVKVMISFIDEHRVMIQIRNLLKFQRPFNKINDCGKTKKKSLSLSLCSYHNNK